MSLTPPPPPPPHRNPLSSSSACASSSSKPRLKRASTAPLGVRTRTRLYPEPRRPPGGTVVDEREVLADITNEIATAETEVLGLGLALGIEEGAGVQRAEETRTAAGRVLRRAATTPAPITILAPSRFDGSSEDEEDRVNLSPGPLTRSRSMQQQRQQRRTVTARSRTPVTPSNENVPTPPGTPLLTPFASSPLLAAPMLALGGAGRPTLRRANSLTTAPAQRGPSRATSPSPGTLRLPTLATQAYPTPGESPLLTLGVGNRLEQMRAASSPLVPAFGQTAQARRVRSAGATLVLSPITTTTALPEDGPNRDASPFPPRRREMDSTPSSPDDEIPFLGGGRLPSLRRDMQVEGRRRPSGVGPAGRVLGDMDEECEAEEHSPSDLGRGEDEETMSNSTLTATETASVGAGGDARSDAGSSTSAPAPSSTATSTRRRTGDGDRPIKRKRPMLSSAKTRLR